MSQPFVSIANELIDDAKKVARLPEMHTFINGEFVTGEGESFDVSYPATGEVIATVAATSVDQVNSAAEAAKNAQNDWGILSAEKRAAVLTKTAHLIEEDLDRVAHLITLENGKTLRDARTDVMACIAFLHSAAGWATRITGTTHPVGHGAQAMTWREPVGVVGIVMPYNAPMLFCGMKIAPAVAVGNTVVAKTPEKSPLAAVAFCEYLQKAGMPAGVVNVVHGFGEIGAAIVDAEPVGMISFTGSSAVGAKVGSRAAELLKYPILELGGKSANIVFADAPFDEAVIGSANAIFKNAGQRCFSGSRLLVHEDIADRFLEEYRNYVSKLKVGDPLNEDSQIGSLIACADVDRVQGMVDRAVEDGAILHHGGCAPDDAPEGSGFYNPTILEVPADADCKEIVQEEVFGPVVVVQRFRNTDEAIAVANDSQYGLAGGCWTNNLATAMRAAREINTGVFWINSYGFGNGPETTIGGRKRSGIGTEKGLDGIEHYTVLKTVIIPAGSVANAPQF